MEPELALLLHTYQDVFALPRGLPYSRSKDHFIPLIQGARTSESETIPVPSQSKRTN